MNFTVAMLQLDPSGHDQDQNLAKGLQYCRHAKTAGADLAVFPELWNIGCTPCPLGDAGRLWWSGCAIDARSYFVRRFAELARELGISIAVTYLEAHRPKPRNTVSIIDANGEVVLKYSKVFLCDFGAEELSKPEPNRAEIGCDVNCSPGVSFDVCTLPGDEGEVSVGAMICADREFPEPATQLMLNGAELVVIPNSCTWDDIRTAGLQTRAFENQIGVAMANYPGARAGRSQAFTCVAWTENGTPQDTLLSVAGNGEQVLLATFDLNAIRAFRKAERWRMDYRRRGLRWWANERS